jgi:hypothetical protein
VRAGHVFEGEVGGGAHFPAGIRVVAWPGTACCRYEWLWRAKPYGGPAMRQGPSELASSGVLPAGGLAAI